MKAKGAIAAGHPLTAEAAKRVLQAGGNAFDAVVAAHFAACVAEPVLASLGGGGFLLACPAGQAPLIFDFFVQTPQTSPKPDLDFKPAVADFGAAQQAFHIGLGSIATPGSVKGLFDIHHRLARLPMVELMAPAVEFARAGVQLNKLQAYLFSVVEPILTATRDSASQFCCPDTGRLHKAGGVVRFPEFADCLEALAREGEGLFYKGEIAQKIVQQCREGGGALIQEDLANYQVFCKTPLALTYKGHRLFTNPPPSSGGLLIGFALQLCEALGLDQFDFGSNEYLSGLSEVMSLTNKARLDAQLSSAGGDEVLSKLMSPGLLAQYIAELKGRAQCLRGTTHISVVDGEGNVAAMTLSNGEGCGHIVPGTGIMLNNMLGEEDLNPHGFQCWTPDQRMTSMMAPTLVQFDSGAEVALGSGGSNRIRTAILQVLLNLLEFDMGLESAVQRPRIHFEEGLLSVEGGFDGVQLQPLLERFTNHKLWPDQNLFFGGVHSVCRDGHTLSGVGDSRRGGVFVRV